MPKIHPIQQSFSSGEVTPLAYARSDIDAYRQAVQTLDNMVVTSHGPTRRRPGLKYVARTAGNNGRVEAMQITDQEFYILLFTDLRLDLNTQQGILPGPNIVTNPRFDNGGTGWTTRESAGSSVSFGSSLCTLSPYLPADSTLTNPEFNSGGTGWTVRESHVQSSVIFTGGNCVMTPRNTIADYAGIAQQATTQFSGQEHVLTIVRQPDCDAMQLDIGTAEADGTYLSVPVPAGSGSITFAFTPAASPYWVTLDTISSGGGEVGIIGSMDVSEPKQGHYAGIAQGVTTTKVGEAHPINVSFADFTQGTEVRLRLGTAEADGTYFDDYIGVQDFKTAITPASADIWITIDAEYPLVNPSVDIEFVAVYEPVTGGQVGFDTVWTEDEIPFIQIIGAPEAGVLYIVHPNHPVYKLTYTEATQAWGLVAVTFTDPPADWTGNTYPSCGVVYQGRLWLGGPHETFWASMSGELETFTLPGTPTDDDAFTFTMANFGSIRWMSGLKNLLLGTENAEYVVTSEGGVVTSSDIQVEQQSAYGSANLQARQVGDKLFYVSPDRRKLRAMQYEWTENNWLSQDLTFLSEHLTATGRIKSMAWAQNPVNVLFITLTDGNGLTFTYDRPNSVYGWSRFTTDGAVLDACVGSYYGTSEITMLTQRVAGNIDLEYLPFDKDYYQDSWVESYDSAGSTVITGLDHLEGEVVQVLTDGAVHPDRLVNGGFIELQWSSKDTVVGKQYVSFMRTLPFDAGDPRGSGMSLKKRWNKIYLRLIDSDLPKINGVRPPARTPSTPMDTSEPSRTEDIMVSNLGWDQWAQIEIEQDLPVSLLVAAIFGELGQNSL